MTLRLSSILAGIAIAGGSQATQLQWSRDYDAALREAGKSGKLIMLCLNAGWCEWCQKMDAETFTDPAVLRAVAPMIPVRLDADGTGRALARRFHVVSYPAILFIDAHGEVRSKIGIFEKGSAFVTDVVKADMIYRQLPQVRAALQKSPGDAAASTRLATALAWQGQTPDAERALARALAAKYRGPELAVALNAIGDNYQTAGQFAKAIALFSKADACALDENARGYARMSIMYCYMSTRESQPAAKAARSLLALKHVDQEWQVAARNYLNRLANRVAGRSGGIAR